LATDCGVQGGDTLGDFGLEAIQAIAALIVRQSLRIITALLAQASESTPGAGVVLIDVDRLS
jgi:hypothetical protein